MKQINWGFIGCGEVTEKKSGPAFNEVEGSQVVAVMSRSEKKARGYAERHHIRKWYTDAQELIDDPDVNAIYIATPPSSHATFAIMAMRAGKPVYIEKPLAASYSDCIRINRISEQTGVPCFVAYYRRYLPYFQKVKEIIKSGAIGDVINVQVRFSVPPRDLDTKSGKEMPWRLQPDIAGGGYFYDLAPHQIDLLQDLFGVITRAHGYPATRAHLYDAEDTVSACFFFESGIPASGSWCFVCAGTCNPCSDHGRKRHGSKKRNPFQKCRGTGECRKNADRGIGQDRYNHNRETARDGHSPSKGIYGAGADAACCGSGELQ